MNKKLVMALVLVIITVTCAISFTACNGNIVYDTGEYGELEYSHSGLYDVITKEGYKFIGWDTTGKKGLKQLYKAQYESIEYYLAENKEVYESQYKVYDKITLKTRITNMQTMEVTEDRPRNAKLKYTTTDNRIGLSQEQTGVFQVNAFAKEFDGIVTITIEDYDYNLNKEIKIRAIRNRIKVESIEIIASNVNGTGNSIKINGSKRLYINKILPEDASFKSVKYTILEVIRNGVDLTKEEQAQIAYFDDNDLYTTDKAQVGDVIRVQAYNERDPEVKSNTLIIFVTED